MFKIEDVSEKCPKWSCLWNNKVPCASCLWSIEGVCDCVSWSSSNLMQICLICILKSWLFLPESKDCRYRKACSSVVFVLSTWANLILSSLYLKTQHCFHAGEGRYSRSYCEFGRIFCNADSSGECVICSLSPDHSHFELTNLFCDFSHLPVGYREVDSSGNSRMHMIAFYFSQEKKHKVSNHVNWSWALKNQIRLRCLSVSIFNTH